MNNKLRSNVNAIFPTFFGGGVKRSSLEYTIIPTECAATFQVLKQSQEIYDFLSKGHFLASNGTRIDSSDFPEWKESENIVYLRGSNKNQDLKVDVTRFISNTNRDKKIAMIDEALAELVTVVGASYRAPAKLSPITEALLAIQGVRILNL